jgi:hypothetical protein
MKNGYTMPYFPFQSGASLSQDRGRHPLRTALDIKKSSRPCRPLRLTTASPTAARQVFAVFALPGSQDLYATAHRRIRRRPGTVLLRHPFLLRRSAHHLRQLAAKRLGRHRRASGHGRHERASNPHVHRPESQVDSTAKATAPSPTIKPAKVDHHLHQQPRNRD